MATCCDIRSVPTTLTFYTRNWGVGSLKITQFTHEIGGIAFVTAPVACVPYENGLGAQTLQV